LRVRLRSNRLVGPLPGTASVEISKSKTHSLGFQVRQIFIISKNVKDVILINGFKYYFDCGDVILDSRDMSHYVIRKISNISDVVLPFFAKYPLQSFKLADFAKHRF